MVSQGVARLLPLAAIVLVSLAFGYLVAFGGRDKGAEPVLTPVPMMTREGPIRVMPLAIDPQVLVVGEPALLFSQICNDSDHPITIQIYFGAEDLVRPHVAELPRVDLLRRKDSAGNDVPVRDTQEERQRRTMEPGCHPTEPIKVPAVPPLLTDGIWRLTLHVIGPGQDITEVSPPFEVRTNK